MAFITANPTQAPEPLVSRAFSTIFRGLVSIAESSNRMKSINRLQAMDDKQLADMGLRREDIARHVFRDVYAI